MAVVGPLIGSGFLSWSLIASSKTMGCRGGMLSDMGWSDEGNCLKGKTVCEWHCNIIKVGIMAANNLAAPQRTSALEENVN